MQRFAVAITFMLLASGCSSSPETREPEPDAYLKCWRMQKRQDKKDYYCRVFERSNSLDKTRQ